MTQIQMQSDEKLIKYVETHCENFPLSDKWVACKKELERRGYMFWFYTCKVIRPEQPARVRYR